MIDIPISEIANDLKDTALFMSMNDNDLALVSSYLCPVFFPKDSVIFNKDDEGHEMYIVRSGLVSSVVIDHDGKKRELSQFAAGRFFGEMAIIEHEKRSATCIAVLDTILYKLDGMDFYRLVWERPLVGSKMLSAMSKVMSSWLNEASGFLNDLVRWGETARKRSVTDSLTGLFNKRFIEERAKSFFAQQDSIPLCSAMMMDLDHFHGINDKYGRVFGDNIISIVGKEMAKQIPENYICSRLSGDEFCFFLPNTNLTTAKNFAELIRKTVANVVINLDPQESKSNNSNAEASQEFLKVTTSIGVAQSSDKTKLSDDLFVSADKALFFAKDAGRNCVYCN